MIIFFPVRVRAIKTPPFPLEFFTCKTLYDFAAFQSIHYKLLACECFNSPQTFQEMLSRCTMASQWQYQTGDAQVHTQFYGNSHVAAYQCTALQLQATPGGHFVNTLDLSDKWHDLDDSIIFVQVMLVQLQIGVQQVGHCEYKHNMYIHRHTYVHAHTSTPHKLKI